MMAELLFEIFSEEIPARMQGWAASALLEKVKDKLPDNLYKEAEVFVTPRRLTLVARGLVSETSEETIERRGPKVGASEQALAGFLKSTGLAQDQLEVRDLNGIMYYFAIKKILPIKIENYIKNVIEEILHGFVWPKSMRWGTHQFTWVRPIKSILCILDGSVIDIHFGEIKSDNKTYGHRFMASEKELRVKNFTEYNAELKNNFVILDHNERKSMIVSQIRTLADKLGCVVKDDPDLFDEITGLVEFPNALYGEIASKFMQLPKEILMTSMRNHQRYVSLLNKDGSLAPYFITIANVKTNNDAIVVIGNEKVLRARLEDALFFWNHDTKSTLESKLPQLKKLGFHEKLGSVYNKTLRIVDLAKYLSSVIGCDVANVSKASLLCKVDLVTEMVSEFPELQGLIGQYYAQNEGLNKQIADSIGQHYLPMGLKDPIALTKEAAIISIADKVDSLVGMFSINEKPTGSKDPFGLRRAAIGIIRTVDEHQLNFDLGELLSKSVRLYEKDELLIKNELVEFFEDRIKNFMKSEDIDHMILNLSVRDVSDICDTINKTRILSDFLLSENGKEILGFYQRAANIVAIEEKKNRVRDNMPTVDKKLFEQEEEYLLHEACASLQESLDESNNLDKKLENLASIRNIVNNYLDNTMINSSNPMVRLNRLALLIYLMNIVNQVVDLSLYNQ